MIHSLVSGEEIILRASLKKDKWKRYRCMLFSCQWASTIFFSPYVLFYGLFGGICREKEANSFELLITNQNIHFYQKIYECGMCCQKSGTKIIPLDKIQDIVLVSDYCGDCCNLGDNPGDVYQLHIQTAAMGGMLPELSVFCIENPQEFKQKILEAKNKIVSDMNIVGQSKTINVQQLLSDNNQKDKIIRILELLERQKE